MHFQKEEINTFNNPDGKQEQCLQKKGNASLKLNMTIGNHTYKYFDA